MVKLKRILSLALVTALITACAGMPAPDGGKGSRSIDYMALRGIQSPTPPGTDGADTSGLAWAETIDYVADGPYPINLLDVPIGVYDPFNQLDNNRGGGRIESQISDELADLLREEALLIPPQKGMDSLLSSGLSEDAVQQLGPAAGVAFDSLDYTECCGGGGNVPPDSELAVGPDHIIAVVNVAFEIYDKLGNSLMGPTTFSSFFAGTPGCSNTGVFDPNVIYDEEADRFILGIDGNGTDYCIAATTGSDPTGNWNRYGFATNVNGNFFDYPHAGVGLDAIYMGANMFGQVSFAEARVWAMDKVALYAGNPMAVVSKSTGNDGTPQPMNLHGFAQGTWPTGGPHYIITDGAFDGSNYRLYSWNDPFGANTFGPVGYVDLDAEEAQPFAAGFPVDAPQMGSSRNIQGNDWRVQDAEYRNGKIWMSHTLSCNPGGGTVNCVRWAQIDPTGPTVLNSGVLGTNNEYRIFPDVAVNECDDMAIGYTKTSGSMYPGVYVSGRESGDAPGTLQAETLVKAGEVPYTSFESSGAYRWGDYSGMTIDPDGQTFWYLGEYSKQTGAGTKWGDYIASFSFPACGEPQAPGLASSPSPGSGATGVDIESVLSWTAGSGADSHDVYFGTSTTPASQGNQAGTSFDPGTLAYATTYYWQVDEVNTVGTTVGTLWSFTTAAAPVEPLAAGEPVPGDTATGISTGTSLSWTEGENTISNDVYFGTSTSPAFQGNQAANSFNPGTLENSTTYFWRIDEVNGPYTTTGPLWSFTTAAAPTFHISGINVQNIAANGKGRSFGRATITVTGTAGGAGVAVSGTFSGGWSGTRSGTTNSSGVLVLETPTVKSAGNFDFCVDTASRSGWIHDQQASGSLLCNPPPAATGSISGMVTDADGGAPIQGASVSADSGQSDITDASGNYTLTGVPIGSRTLTATAAGFDPATPQATTVTDGGNSIVSFALTATPIPTTGSITGVVTDSNGGAPIQGASVSVDSGQSATTDAGGNYTLTNVPTGSRTVSASAAGYEPVTPQSTTVTDGGTSVVNFSLTATPTGGGVGSIKGTVTSSSGAKLGGVLIETDTGQSATSNKGGKYNLQNVPEGSRTVTASASGFSDTIVTGVDIGNGTTTTLDIQMNP